MTKRITVITGTRAEYGLLVPVLNAIEAHGSLELQLIVTGTHLTTESIKDIRHAINARVRMQSSEKRAAPSSGGRGEDVQALARGVAGIGEALETLSPDVVLVLGDRIEALAGALAAQVGGYRLAHIHGGDRAEGVADEAMRHAISKLAHLHFAATQQSRDRLVRMGELPEHVYNTGSPAVDGLADVEAADDAPELIVMQHPIGASNSDERYCMEQTLACTQGYTRLIMSPNHDPGRDGIMEAIRDVDLQPVDHLPRTRFLSLLKGCRAIVGNSSAGLIEAAVLGTPAVNIGPRQGGRERPASVIDADYGHESVSQAIDAALMLHTTGLSHPYGGGNTGQRIAERLAGIDLQSVPLHKRNSY